MDTWRRMSYRRLFGGVPKVRPMVKSWMFDIFNYPYSPDPDRFDPQKCQELYDWHMDLWVAAEDLGFDGVFFSEHHFTDYNVTPSPNLLVAALAARARRIRLGVMANILPFHNPRRLAEEAAMLDYLTGGRLEVGLGRGVDEQEFVRAGIDMSQTRQMFEEGVEFIHSAWRDPVFSHHGKFWDYENTSIWPRSAGGRSPRRLAPGTCGGASARR